MPHNSESELQRLLRLPWTIIRDITPEGDVVLRVKEIPSAVGSGDTQDALEADLWESLTESLRAYLHFGDEIPLPHGASKSFLEVPSTATVKRAPFFVMPSDSQTGTTSALA